MFYKRLKQENKELKDMVELLKKQNDEKSEWIKHLIKNNGNHTKLEVGYKKDGHKYFESEQEVEKMFVFGESAMMDGLSILSSIPLKQTPVSDLYCSTRLRNILKGLIYKNEDQSFKSVFDIYSKRELQNTRNLGVKLFEELDSMRLEAGIEYKN